MAVNQERLRQWYLALKSGEYQQSQNRLRTAEGYCCWGVLCDISEVGDWLGYTYSVPGSLPQATALPNVEVEQWLGIESYYRSVEIPETVRQDPDFPNEIRQHTRDMLHYLNDKGVPFRLIADIIWHNWGEGEPPEVPSE